MHVMTFLLDVLPLEPEPPEEEITSKPERIVAVCSRCVVPRSCE